MKPAHLSISIYRTVTLTRKMFTMLLSVIVYNHKLEFGQWLGAGVVFSGITLEAYIKRKGIVFTSLLFELFVNAPNKMYMRRGLSRRRRKLKLRTYSTGWINALCTIDA